MTDPRTIAERLTVAQREAVLALTDDYHPGPELPDEVCDCLTDLMAAGLVERQFGDSRPPAYQGDGDGFTVRLRACWFFRLTPLGIAVRRVLEGG